MKSKIFQETLDSAPIEMDRNARRRAEYIKALHKWFKDAQSSRVKHAKGIEL